MIVHFIRNVRRWLLRPGAGRVNVHLVSYARHWLRMLNRRRIAAQYGVEFNAFVKRHFDPDYYLSRNPDVAEAGVDALTHWIHHGLREGRVFSPQLTVRLVSAETHKDSLLTYISFGKHLLEVYNGFPEEILSQLMEQGKHEPILLGPGALALPYLPIQTVGKVAIELDAAASCIDTMPRVVFVVPLLGIGGAEKFAADICHVLQIRQVGPILVIVTDQNEEDAVGWKELSIVEPFRKTKVLFWRDVCSTHADPRMLASLLAYMEPEFIIVTYSGVCLQAIARYGKRLSQKSKIFCTFFSLGKNGLGAPYGVTFARFTSSFATSITDNALAATILDRRFAVLRKPAAVIPPQAPIASEELFERRLSRRISKGAGGGVHRWVWVSRLDKAKGIDVLRGLAQLRPRDLFDLYGPLSSSLAQLGLDLPNIRFCGILKDTSLADFSRYHGFLFTSPSEGMPNVVLELSQHAIPMIISNAGGLPETFDGESAIIVPTHQTAALTADAFHKACDRLISISSATKATMVRRAYQKVRERHSADAFQARVCSVFEV